MGIESEFGRILKKLRLEKNISQVELAELSQLDRTFISLLERGLRQPSLTSIFQIAIALKVRPSEIVEGVEQSLRRARWTRLRK